MSRTCFMKMVFVPLDRDLSSREVEVLRLASCGLKNEEIAGVLRVQEATVRTQLHHAMQKLGARSRTQACMFALFMGLFTLHSIAETLAAHRPEVFVLPEED